MADNSEDDDIDTMDDDESPELEDKQERLERERDALLDSLAGGDYSAMKTRVAAILNNYPRCRNSDTALTLKYWEMFQPEHFDRNGITPAQLFRLEPQHYIVRARAKIQNEYGLFQAEEAVKRNRRARESEIKDAVVDDAAPSPITFVFADETGKTHQHVIVASAWFLTAEAVFKFSRAVDRWQQESRMAKREMHFARLGRGDADSLVEYLDVVDANSQYLSFKIAAVERARTRRTIEDAVAKLHEHVVRFGARHELESGRITTPREIEFSLDSDQSLDAFALSEMRDRIARAFQDDHGPRITISTVRAIDSRRSPPIQLADMVAGAINRRLNTQETRNYKDDYADMIIEKLHLDLTEHEIPELDVAVQFRV